VLLGPRPMVPVIAWRMVAPGQHRCQPENARLAMFRYAKDRRVQKEKRRQEDRLELCSVGRACATANSNEQRFGRLLIRFALQN
jgi:hypothetical protein